MPLKPDFAGVIAEGTAASLDFAAYEPSEVARMMRDFPFPLPPIADPAEVEEIAIPGPIGPIPARIYRPAGSGPFPIVVNFHGGGWVLGTLDMEDVRCHHLAANAGCAVISIDYCLAPEHPYPAPFEDCYAATVWVADNAERLGFDGGRLAISGNSAGGNLAAAVAIAARDRDGPSIRYQLLYYPAVDTDMTRPSYVENGEEYGLTTVSMEWFLDQYLPKPGDRSDPYAVPMREKDLGNLPPALVITAEYDVLRDEGEDYARALRAAGVEASCIRHDGVPHGFITMIPDAPESRLALEQGSTAIRNALFG